MDWNYFKYLEAVALTGSLSRAAQLLKIDVSTLSRQLQRLERDSGRKIFRREGSHYRPTREGEAWIAAAQRMRGEVEGLAADRPSADPRITVTSLEVFLNAFLIPHLDRFGIKLDLIGADRTLDLSRREADVAIRFGRPQTGDYLIQKLFAAGHAIYCARRFESEIPTDRRRARWVTLNEEQDPAFAGIEDVKWFREAMGNSAAFHRVTSCAQILSALQAGPYLGILPCYAGDREPSLQRLSPDEILFTRQGWLVVHRETAGLAPVRRFLEELKRLVKAESKKLQG